MRSKGRDRARRSPGHGSSSARSRNGRSTAASEVPRALPEVAIERILDRQDWSRLAPHLLRMSVDVEASTRALRGFAHAALEWNGRVSNLISHSDTGRILERHILESVEPAHWLESSGARRWLDFGSGGGFPAIPLALLGVGEHWTLVESRRNKSLFLRKIVQTLKMGNVDVVLDRLENRLGTEWEGAFDGFTSRATMTLAPTLELAGRLMRPGGVAFLWKGSRRETEMEADHDWKSRWELDGLLGIGSGLTVISRFKRKE
jgi:16S rRNA (guanine527-N7)-methyltransferase